MTDSEINEAVARKLGWTKCEHSTMENGKIVPAFGWVKPNPIKPHYHEGLPDYCHSIQAAWEIVEGLASRDDWWVALRYKPRIKIGNGGKWNFIIVDSKNNAQIEEIADTAPKAICLAFLATSYNPFTQNSTKCNNPCQS